MASATPRSQRLETNVSHQPLSLFHYFTTFSVFVLYN
jgi:hypothetical protein